MCGYSCGNQSVCSGGGCGYSSLESAVYSASPSYNSVSSSDVSYLVADSQVFDHPGLEYTLSSKISDNPYVSKPTITYAPVTSGFLLPSRPGPVFVGEMSDLKEFVEEAFTKTTGKSFPRDIQIQMLPSKDFKKSVNSEVLGFAVNRKGFGVSEIFVKKDELAKVLLTIGHELGHVLSSKLSDNVQEEAKAFAFQVAWLRAIKDHNIANLQTSIRLDPPAQNGVHDKALDFVLGKVNHVDPLVLFSQIGGGSFA